MQLKKNISLTKPIRKCFL